MVGSAAKGAAAVVLSCARDVVSKRSAASAAISLLRGTASFVVQREGDVYR